MLIFILSIFLFNFAHFHYTAVVAKKKKIS